MPRRSRIVLPGYFHHVTQRGNFRQDIFCQNEHRIKYLKYIEEYCQKYSVKIYAYCLMRNHVHFIVKPEKEDSLAKAFNVAHQRYSYYFNQQENRLGHLWQARFYSCVLHGTRVLRAIRYVERNPVRAKLVVFPWEYYWSSVRMHLGLKDHCPIVSLSDYREYVEVPSWEEYLQKNESEQDLYLFRENTKQGSVIGPEFFIKKLEQDLNKTVSLFQKSKTR